MTDPANRRPDWMMTEGDRQLPESLLEAQPLQGMTTLVRFLSCPRDDRARTTVSCLETVEDFAMSKRRQ